MDLLDTIKVSFGSEERLIELCQGDLTDLSPDEAVDILVVSAFPDDYLPTPSSLIGSLSKKGVIVEQLAKNKERDLRASFSCWLSTEVAATQKGIQFKRILCFEPSGERGGPPDVVGDIFRALAPVLGGYPQMSVVAMPIVAGGDQSYGVSEILPPLLDAAVHWMALGLPLKRLKIVAYSSYQADEAKELFSVFKAEYQRSNPPFEAKLQNQYDLFISYAHEDEQAVGIIVKELKEIQPTARIFVDRLNLKVGCAWQPEIFEAIDSCQKILVLFSPSYLNSKVCKEEFNIAWARSRDDDREYLFPIYLLSASLPTYMKYRQYVDCREFDETKLRSATADLVSSLWDRHS